MKTVILNETDSTNEYVKRNAADFADGDAVVAFCQTNGKGTSGRSFVSPVGGLYVSFVVKGKHALPSSLVTPAAAVAVYKAVKRVFGVSLGIKWVNDLYKDEKKVCGILCENHNSYGIIGVGINVSPPKNGFPPDLTIAGTVLNTSVSDRKKVRLARLIRKYVFAYLNSDGEKTLGLYRKNSVVIGKKVEVTRGEERTEGTAAYITDEGYLAIDTAHGEKTVFSGTLRFLDR